MPLFPHEVASSSVAVATPAAGTTVEVLKEQHQFLKEEASSSTPASASAGAAIYEDAKQLQQDGYAILVMLSTADERARVRLDFTDSMKTFPEYQRHPTNPTLTPCGKPIVYVAGGYGGMGNPSSFHCENARETRECILAATIPLLSAYCNLPTIAAWAKKMAPPKTARKTAVFMERNSVRCAGTTVGADSYHRDSSPRGVLKIGDEVFGCIANINEEPIVRTYTNTSAHLSRPCVFTFISQSVAFPDVCVRTRHTRCNCTMGSGRHL